MKARVEKKLSKRLVELAPKTFKSAWVDFGGEPSELAYEQGSSVSGLYNVGGGVDYWGEGQDSYTTWQWWLDNFMWVGPFKSFTEWHEFEGFPDITGFKLTTRNLLKLAESIG